MHGNDDECRDVPTHRTRRKGKRASVITDTLSPTEQKTYIEYTNSLEGALEEAKEHAAAITTDRDRMMEKSMNNKN